MKSNNENFEILDDMEPNEITTIRVSEISNLAVHKAEQVLIDNGIEPCEAPVVLQALGFVLLDTDLYGED